MPGYKHAQCISKATFIDETRTTNSALGSREELEWTELGSSALRAYSLEHVMSSECPQHRSIEKHNQTQMGDQRADG